jgi:hypothetical protein
MSHPDTLQIKIPNNGKLFKPTEDFWNSIIIIGDITVENDEKISITLPFSFKCNTITFKISEMNFRQYIYMIYDRLSTKITKEMITDLRYEIKQKIIFENEKMEDIEDIKEQVDHDFTENMTWREFAYKYPQYFKLSKYNIDDLHNDGYENNTFKFIMEIKE